MKRFHALEWEDLHWFPKSWRDYGTDFLRFIAVRFDAYKPIIPVIKKGIDAASHHDWVDCASGGGGSIVPLAKELKKDFPQLRVTLSDYYPNVKAFEQTKSEDPGLFQYEEKPVNAMDLPPHLRGKFRTLFGAFHHFRPREARRILQNAVDNRSPIAIFEAVGRNPMSWFSMLFVPLNVLLFTPFIRPVRWEVLPFIYLLPIIPLYILWDGVASILRSYSKTELEDLVSQLDNASSFNWEIGSAKNGPMSVAYLLGTPAE
jgi:hypothetical protein